MKRVFFLATVIFLFSCHARVELCTLGATMDPSVVGEATIGSSLDDQDRENLDEKTKRAYDNNETLDVDDIITMHKSGLCNAKIIGAIQKTHSRYCHLSVKEIDKLQKEGVSSEVIDYMLGTCDRK